MVRLSSIFRIDRKKVRFIDSLRIYVKGGVGGQGLANVGGNGGNGGDVILVGDTKATLIKLAKQNKSKRFIAEPGENSRKKFLLGKPGKHVVINVPIGVCVKTDEGREIGDLNAADETVIVARGGRGGGPWNEFVGEKAEPRNLKLDLKLIADVGLVGFPNAGKSSLLKAVSRASPQVASYPFTTLKPNIGTMMFDDLRQITIADLPGLIEGAHMNVGMGHSFLKHVERTKLLLLMVDIHGFKLGVDHEYRTALETIILLNKELELYKEELLDKPSVLVLNKTDLEGADEKVEETIYQLKNVEDVCDKDMLPKRLMKFDEIIPISAKAGTSIEQLKNKIRTLLDVYACKNYDKSPDAKVATEKEWTDPRKGIYERIDFRP